MAAPDNLEERVKEHKLKIRPKSFTARYNCDKLVYFEIFEKAVDAMVREKRFKKWKRDWKTELIEEMKPNWTDLSINWRLNYNRIRKQS